MCTGSHVDLLTPTLVEGLHGMRIVDISCGDNHTLVVRDSECVCIYQLRACYL